MHWYTRWLIRLMASALVSVTCLAIITMVFNGTIFSSHYVEKKAVQIDAYSRLSNALVTDIANKAGSADPQLETQLKGILTPSLLQTKVSGALDELQSYYKGNGSPPVIDLTGVAQQARAAGLAIPANSEIDKPITLASNNQVKGDSKYFNDVRWASIIAIVVLVIGILALSWESHRFTILPDVMITCGVLIGILAGILAVLPGAVNRFVKFNFTSNAFASLAHDLIIAIVKDQSKTFGIIAAILIVVGIVLRIIAGRHKAQTSTTTPVRSKQK